MKCKHNPFYQKAVKFTSRNSNDMRNSERNAFARFDVMLSTTKVDYS